MFSATQRWLLTLRLLHQGQGQRPFQSGSGQAEKSLKDGLAAASPSDAGTAPPSTKKKLIKKTKKTINPTEFEFLHFH